jgi:hypothetical protein
MMSLIDGTMKMAEGSRPKFHAERQMGFLGDGSQPINRSLPAPIIFSTNLTRSIFVK